MQDTTIFTIFISFILGGVFVICGKIIIDEIRNIKNSKTSMTGTYGQFIFSKGDESCSGQITKRDEYFLSELKEARSSEKLSQTIKGQIWRIRDTDPENSGRKENRTWDFYGYHDDDVMLIIYKAQPQQPSKGCIYAKLVETGDYQGFYLGEHTNHEAIRTLDCTPLLIKKFVSKYALFDWDNTVRNGYTIFPWIKYLVKNNVFDKECMSEIRKVQSKFSEKLITHDQYAEEINSLYAKGIKGQTVKLIDQLAKQYKLQDKRAFFPEIEKLFEKLHDAGIIVIVVSGAPYRLLRMYEEEFHINSLMCFKEKEENGKFTGEIEYNYGYDKEKTVENIINEKQEYPYMAFGDSESDYPMLKKALYPFYITGLEKRNFSEIEKAFIHIDKEKMYEEVSKRIEKSLNRKVRPKKGEKRLIFPSKEKRKYAIKKFKQDENTKELLNQSELFDDPQEHTIFPQAAEKSRLINNHIDRSMVGEPNNQGGEQAVADGNHSGTPIFNISGSATIISGGNFQESTLVAGSGNTVNVEYYQKCETMLSEVEKALDTEDIPEEKKEIARELITDARNKVKDRKSRDVIKAALIGLKDFLLEVAANVAGAVVATMLATLK